MSRQDRLVLTGLGWKVLDQFLDLIDRTAEDSVAKTHRLDRGKPTTSSQTLWQRILNLDLGKPAEEAGYKNLIMPYISGGGVDLGNAKLVTLRGVPQYGDIAGWIDGNNYLQFTAIGNQTFLGHDPKIFGYDSATTSDEILIVPEGAECLQELYQLANLNTLMLSDNN